MATQPLAGAGQTMVRILTGDGLGAGGAPLGEELAEALGAVRLVVAGREPLARQRLDTVRAEVEFNKNTLPMKVKKACHILFL